MIYLFCLLFAVAPSSAKVEYKEPPLRKGWMIVVKGIDRKRRLLEIDIEKSPGVGPNLARPEKLADAVDITDADEKKKFIDDPSRFVGSRYELKKDLELVFVP